MKFLNRKRLRILVDLDGVLADFHQTYLNLVGFPASMEAVRQHGGNIPPAIGQTDEEFWDSVPREFFEGLPLLSDARELLQIVRTFDPEFHICSSPGTNKPWVITEKVNWVHKHLDPNFNRFIISNDKPIAANTRTVLLDDWDGQCNNFQVMGGTSILVPRPWNRYFAVAHEAAKIIELQLTHLADVRTRSPILD